MHTQGIKAERSLCVIEWLGKSIKGAQKLEWEPAKVLKSRGDIVRHCGLPKGSSTLDEMLRLAAGAFKVRPAGPSLRTHVCLAIGPASGNALPTGRAAPWPRCSLAALLTLCAANGRAVHPALHTRSG